MPRQSPLAAPAALARDRRKHRCDKIDRDQAEQQIEPEEYVHGDRGHGEENASQDREGKAGRVSGIGNDRMARRLHPMRRATVRPQIVGGRQTRRIYKLGVYVVSRMRESRLHVSDHLTVTETVMRCRHLHVLRSKRMQRSQR